MGPPEVTDGVRLPPRPYLSFGDVHNHHALRSYPLPRRRIRPQIRRHRIDPETLIPPSQPHTSGPRITVVHGFCEGYPQPLVDDTSLTSINPLVDQGYRRDVASRPRSQGTVGAIGLAETISDPHISRIPLRIPRIFASLLTGSSKKSGTTHRGPVCPRWSRCGSAEGLSPGSNKGK